MASDKIKSSRALKDKFLIYRRNKTKTAKCRPIVAKSYRRKYLQSRK